MIVVKAWVGLTAGLGKNWVGKVGYLVREKSRVRKLEYLIFGPRVGEQAGAVVEARPRMGGRPRVVDINTLGSRLLVCDGLLVVQRIDLSVIGTAHGNGRVGQVVAVRKETGSKMASV